MFGLLSEPILTSFLDCFPFLGVWSVFSVRSARTSLLQDSFLVRPNDLNTYKGMVLPGERTGFHGDAREGDNLPNASLARAKSYCVHRRRTVTLEVPGDVV